MLAEQATKISTIIHVSKQWNSYFKSIFNFKLWNILGNTDKKIAVRESFELYALLINLVNSGKVAVTLIVVDATNNEGFSTLKASEIYQVDNSFSRIGTS